MDQVKTSSDRLPPSRDVDSSDDPDAFVPGGRRMAQALENLRMMSVPDDDQVASDELPVVFRRPDSIYRDAPDEGGES